MWSLVVFLCVLKFECLECIFFTWGLINTSHLSFIVRLHLCLQEYLESNSNLSGSPFPAAEVGRILGSVSFLWTWHRLVHTPRPACFFVLLGERHILQNLKLDRRVKLLMLIKGLISFFPVTERYP